MIKNVSIEQNVPKHILTDKNVQLWTETEQDQFRRMRTEGYLTKCILKKFLLSNVKKTLKGKKSLQTIFIAWPFVFSLKQRFV